MAGSSALGHEQRTARPATTKPGQTAKTLSAVATERGAETDSASEDREQAHTSTGTGAARTHRAQQRTNNKGHTRRHKKLAHAKRRLEHRRKAVGRTGAKTHETTKTEHRSRRRIKRPKEETLAPSGTHKGQNTQTTEASASQQQTGKGHDMTATTPSTQRQRRCRPRLNENKRAETDSTARTQRNTKATRQHDSQAGQQRTRRTG
ncbi:hypothetical protein TRVL_06647 [Trypanosoma vivax]|nr:hypothetical protein TRVL_06647 [Trypanosoma vivax]